MSSPSTQLETEFKQAQQFVQSGPAESEPSNEQKLLFYAYFKQATEGPNTGKRPGAFDLIKRAKYDAWKKLGEMTKDEAMKGYIANLEKSSPNGRNSLQTKVVQPDLLRGKVAVVTGGGSGICKVITEYLAYHGANTVIISRTLSKLEQAAKEINQLANNGTECFPVNADVRDYKALSEAFDKALKKFGRIDILINGSAGNFLCPASQLSSGGFKTVLEIDTVGTFHSSKLAYDKYMKKHGGNIVNLSMTLHNTASIMQVHAGCAKSAIDTMTKHLAVEWGLDGVRVNSIQIGPIEGTEGFSRLLPKEELDKYKKTIPLQRFGQPIDIARMVLFLVSDAASYITAAIIPVEGASQYTTNNIYGYPEVLQMSKM
ncbi:hypothetical protein C9374_002044 [Naegleria lovaniensis]|uniref:2,4-dienoyl-CoA reductase [(3E)-enoyl-CoA-producing] n=1 Tax=Naegleria lovaniensis TaxID=51637 RepID=A0AA88KMI5_NAELO|nr:uncharacterized protein C9374_002044 [Naegleria lovaniensis]KAG2387009.1 hypothetical protein C9374_002044 [Naegleria lovaniensis]